MTTDGRRDGDDRPLCHDEGIVLTLTPEGHKPFRFLPKHGQPYCIGEWLSQHTASLLASWVTIYTALVATLVLVFVVFGVPFVDGR